jgi:hypothetical protein
VTLLSLVQSDRGQNIPVGGCFGQMQQPEASVLLRGNAAVPARSRALMDWNGGGGPPEAMANSRSPIAERKPAMGAHAECRPLGHPVGSITPLVCGW